MVNSLKDNTAPNSLLYDRDGARHGEKRLLHGPWPCATTGRETLDCKFLIPIDLIPVIG